MKTLKKFIPIIMAVGGLCSCSSSNPKPGKLENLVGTYELVKYEMRRDESDSKSTYDRKAEIGAKAYFTIDKDGYGYYGYADNNTPARVNQIFSHFNYDEDKPNLIRTVDMGDGVTHKYYDEKSVGCLDEPQLGFRDELFQKTLSYTLHSGHMLFDKDAIIHYQYVRYKRIDSKGGLDKINSLMGTSVSFQKPYEMKSVSGYHVYRCQPREGVSTSVRGIYEYAIIDFDSYNNGQVTMYYSLAAQPGLQTKQLTVSVKDKGYSLKMEGLDKTFYAEGSGSGLPIGFSTHMEDYSDSEPINWESFSHMYSNVTLEELIDMERRPDFGPYVVRVKANREKNYSPMSYDSNYNIFINGLTLEANEEFNIFTSNGGFSKYYEDYEDEGTDGGKIVEGSVVQRGEGEPVVHNFKATEAGTYDISVDLQTTDGKVHIVHE